MEVIAGSCCDRQSALAVSAGICGMLNMRWYIPLLIGHLAITQLPRSVLDTGIIPPLAESLTDIRKKYSFLQPLLVSILSLQV